MTKKVKFEPNESEAINFFINNGYVIFKNIFDISSIETSKKFILSAYETLDLCAKRGEFESDVNGFAISILSKFIKTNEYEEIVKSKALINLMKYFLGPDIALLGYDALWINVPKDNDPVLLKSLHTDAWTGTSINTIFSKVFFTDVDSYNGVGVCPGSHLQGLIPVRNRNIDPSLGIDFDIENLDNIKQGDLLIWHPLLIHSTIGHSDKNLRVSMTSRYTSTESSFSSQERALGYTTCSVGPMNQILRLIGNDNLLPLRTYGGFVGIDRRMAEIYTHSEYKKIKDYSEFI
jgi:ectoine hydroxylase-related dioxygenase (phytanoyl-CoA dioxygenase family)